MKQRKRGYSKGFRKNVDDNTFDYDRMAEAIVNANLKLEEEKKAQVEYGKQKELEKRKEILGEKDFSHIDNRFKRKLYEQYNTMKMVCKILFLKEAEARYFKAIHILTLLVVAGILSIIEIVSYIIALACICVPIYQYIFENGRFILIVQGVAFGILIDFFAKLIKIARIEVENTENSEE